METVKGYIGTVNDLIYYHDTSDVYRATTLPQTTKLHHFCLTPQSPGDGGLGTATGSDSLRRAARIAARKLRR